MLPSTANPIRTGDSIMPGDYESWPSPGARNLPFSGPLSPSQPIVPTPRTSFPQLPPTPPIDNPAGITPFPQLPPTPPIDSPTGRTPFPQLPPVYPTGRSQIRRAPVIPALRPVRPHRHRRRSCTPNIVIDRQFRGGSSWGGRRVIVVPLHDRPTLGLRGPPKRVIEIERIPCCRRRRSRKVCYEYDDPPPMVSSQPAAVVANRLVIPTADPHLLQAQSSLIVPTNNIAVASSAALLQNLTPEMINNLPKQTVVLPPMHLPGSQANAETELNTVIFPAEIINPVDGTLSIIQTNPSGIGGGTTNIQSHIAAPIQPQLINIPTTVGASMIPRGLPISSAIRPTNLGMSVTPGGLPISSIIRPTNPGMFVTPGGLPVPPTIRPTNIGMPITPGGLPPGPRMASDPLMQRFQELFQRLRFPQTQPTSPSRAYPPVIRPTMPPITEFNPANSIVNNPPTASPMNIMNIGSYPSSNIRPTNTPNIGSYRPANITPYSPANITPYRSSAFTSSTPVSNVMYRPANIVPSNSSDINPYRPANITPYTNLANRSLANSQSQPSFSSAATPYASSPSITPSGSSTTFPSSFTPPFGINNNSINSTVPTSFPSTNSTPKSILRNGTSNGGLSNTPYANFNPSNVSSSNDIIRKTARFT